jgi:hypothetical protein
MAFVHIKRGVLWSKEVSKTLIDFWIKHPEETATVLTFLQKKAFAIPRFLSKNVLIEKESQSYESLLEETTELYKSLKNINSTSPHALKKLDKKLKTRAQLLYFIVRSTKPAVVVETGVASGQSTGFILQAMKDNKKGKLYSIDLPFQWYTYTQGKTKELHLDSLPPGNLPGYLVPEVLKKNWKLLMGDTYKELPKLLKKLKNIDIFIHDSEHTYKTMMFEYETSWPFIKKSGLLLSDDVHFTKAFDDFAKKVKAKPQKFQSLGILIKKAK